MIMFAVFCSTSIGRNIIIVSALNETEAKSKALNWLTGEDIDRAEVIKVERIDPDVPCVFWDNEFEE